MTLPVMIGSRAALHGGFLPAWREGKVRDTDVLVTADWLCRYCERHGLPVPLGSTRGVLTGPVGGLNWEVAGDGSHELMASLCRQTIQPGWSDTPALVATKEVVWATRVYTVGYNPHNLDKAVRDAAWYDALDLELTDDHRRLAEMRRKSSLAFLNDMAVRRVGGNTHENIIPGHHPK